MGYRPEAGGPCRVERVSVAPPGRNRASLRPSVCSAPRNVKRKEKGVPVPELDTEDREKLDKRKFAYVDKEGEGHLPINDDGHVRNAIARFNQTDFESGAKQETARKKIVTAAKRRGIKVGRADNVTKRKKTGTRTKAKR
jgi:hypothetical protein